MEFVTRLQMTSGRLAAAALLAAAFPQLAPGIEVTVNVYGSTTSHPVNVLLSAEPVGRPDVNPSESGARVVGTAQVDLPIAGASHWRLQARAEGFWSKAISFEAGGAIAPQLDLWPAGIVLGRFVSFPQPDRAPGSIQLRLDPTFGTKAGQERPSGLVECPLEEGRLRCVVPAGLYNIRISAENSPSVFRWGIPVEAGTTVDLGDFSPAAGSAIVGRLDRPEPGVRQDETSGTPIRVLRSAGNQLVSEGKPVYGPDGSFSVTGLPEGRYVIVASEEGYLPDRLEVGLRASEEIELPPFRLTRASKLVVDISPPLDPFGKPWSIVLQDGRPARNLGPIHESFVDRAGKWSFDGAGIGRPYRLKVKTSFDEPWWVDSVDFTPSEGQTTRKILIEPVKVAGTVTLGKLRLAGHVLFRDGGGVLASLPIREDGRFVGFLPHPGAWSVQVSSDAPRVRRTVQTEIPPEGGEIAIHLPATAVEGEVVDENGVRVAGAVLKVTRLGPPESVSHKLDDGSFLLTGLAAGEYEVYATALKENRESVTYRMTINDDGSSDASPLRILAKKKRELRGRVTSAGGRPVAAGIQLLWSVGDTRGGYMITKATDADGRFAFPIRDEQEKPCLFVQPNGLASRILQVMDTSVEQQIVLSPAGGTLALSADKLVMGAPQPEGQTLKYLLKGNCIMPVASFVYMGLGLSLIDGGNHVTTPLLEPATYTLCGLEPMGIRLYTGNRTPTENCSTGILSDGGRLVLTVK